jgi:hypothetical protein
MWTAYYEEWKRHNGKPPGYGADNQVEPWISDEVFNELVDAEINLWGRHKTNMGFISRKLVEKVSPLLVRPADDSTASTPRGHGSATDRTD